MFLTANTFNFNGTTQNIPALVSASAVAYNNLTISGGGTKTMTASFSVAGTLALTNRSSKFQITILRSRVTLLQPSPDHLMELI
ncbi:MAG: hypothetical protein U0X76_11020 [Bacteroidia bacterium]